MPTMTYDGATGPACIANYEGADHISTPTMGGFMTRNPGTIQYVRLPSEVERQVSWWISPQLQRGRTACRA